MLLKKTVFVCVNYRDVFYNIFANNSILLSKRLMQRTFRSLCFKIRDMRTKNAYEIIRGVIYGKRRNSRKTYRLIKLTPVSAHRSRGLVNL